MVDQCLGWSLYPPGAKLTNKNSNLNWPLQIPNWPIEIKMLIANFLWGRGPFELANLYL